MLEAALKDILEENGLCLRHGACRDSLSLTERMTFGFFTPEQKAEHNCSALWFPGRDLLSRAAYGHSTIGAEGLNCRVRDGNGCFTFAITTGNLVRRLDFEPTWEPVPCRDDAETLIN